MSMTEGKAPQRWAIGPMTRVRLAVLALAVVLLVVAAVRLPGAGRQSLELSADFADTTGIYVGNEVQYLGVPIGEITGIEPRGPVMRVRMEIDAGTPIPKEAGAEILQSALLTDRYVQLGPAYEGGARLADGAHIDAKHTRSPINLDDVGKAVDNLILALDQTGPGGRDIGDLLHATAETFDGNGGRVRDLLMTSRQALAAINDKSPDLKAVVSNLAVLATTLGQRDALIRRFTANLATSSQVVADQSASLDQTLRSLEQLTASVTTFVRKNRSKLTTNLRDVAAVAETIRGQQDALAQIFDLMPTGAENIARAFDKERGAIRVQFALRDTLIFSNLVRAQVCASTLGLACAFLFTADGTGALDVLLDAIRDAVPGSLP